MQLEGWSQANIDQHRTTMRATVGSLPGDRHRAHFSSELLTRSGIHLGYGDFSVEQLQNGIGRLAIATDSI